jgi:hypothetical protein
MTVRLLSSDYPMRQTWRASIAARRQEEAMAAGERARAGLPCLVRPLLGWLVAAVASETHHLHAEAQQKAARAAEEAVLMPLLQALDSDGELWLVLPGIVLQARADLHPLELDTLVLGPPGIISVEVKAWTGHVELGPGDAVVARNGSRDVRKSPLRQLELAAGLLIRVLHEAKLPYVPLHTALCLPWLRQPPAFSLPPGYTLRTAVLWGSGSGAALARYVLALPRTCPVTAEDLLRCLQTRGMGQPALSHAG